MRTPAVVLLLALVWVLPAGCAGNSTSRLRAAILDLEEHLGKAQAAQGPLCEPEALASAQTCLALAKEEFQEGDYWEAEDILDTCRESAAGIWDRILACGLDRDGDGIPDRFDRCPDEPENYNGYLDHDGCPDRLPERALLVPDRIEIVEPVRFQEENGSLLAPSQPVLRDVARVLLENPGIRIRIQAHVDDRVPEDQAMAVTRDRAFAVRNELERMGVPAERMDAAGLGGQEPIAPNDSPMGRLVNQRIEFLRIP